MYKNPFSLLKTSLYALSTHPAILFPFGLLAFIQLLILEILYFAPRYPLAIFFGPIIRRLAGESYMHYPQNFVLLQKWFAESWIQIPVYILFYSVGIGMAVLIISDINSQRKVRLPEIFKRTFAVYAHLMVAAGVTVGILYGFSVLYGLVMQRALQIRSISGIYFYIKMAVIYGAPLFQLLFSGIVTAALAFVIPLIMLEKRNVFSALWLNFRRYGRDLFTIFLVVFLSGLIYVPILLLKYFQQWYQAVRIPELLGVVAVLGVIVLFFVDAIQVTAITTYYLLDQETRE